MAEQVVLLLLINGMAKAEKRNGGCNFAEDKWILGL